jgi:hypothetical protein
MILARVGEAYRRVDVAQTRGEPRSDGAMETLSFAEYFRTCVDPPVA